MQTATAPRNSLRAAYNALDEFTRGYLEAAHFTERPEPLRRGRDLPLSECFPRRTIRAAVIDCTAFLDYVAEQFPAARRCLEDEPARAGRDFWYTRNGHGCGFWDGDWPEPHGANLTESAKRWGDCPTYWRRGQMHFH